MNTNAFIVYNKLIYVVINSLSLSVIYWKCKIVVIDRPVYIVRNVKYERENSGY
jgi:hypothetical protein